MTKISTITNIICYSFVFLIACSFSAYADDICPTLRELMNNGIGDNFILREAYLIIASATHNVAIYTWARFAKPLQAIVGLGAAIYIAMYTLKNIGSFSQQDTAAYLSNEKTGIIPVAVKMMIIVWLLSNQSFIYKNLIGMAISTSVEIGKLIGSNSGIGLFSAPENLMELYYFVIKQIIAFNNALYKIVATGQLLICMAFSVDNTTYWKVIPFGAALWVYGWMIIIGVSFYMLDVLFRLGVGCIMLPFAIACGMSKFTIDFTRKTWNLFMNVGFNFIMFGIVIGFTYKMISNCLGLYIPENKILNRADIEQINEQLDLGVFVVTALCSMISYQLFMQIEGIVDSISGTSSISSLGQQVGAKVGGLATRVATKPVRELGNIGKAGAEVVGKDVKRYFNNIRHNVSNRITGSTPYQAVSNSWVGRSYRSTKRFLRWDER